MNRFFCKMILFISSFLLLQNENSYAQDTSKIATNPLLEMSLEELLNLEVEVASTKSGNIFTIPSTVTVISKDEIERYNYTSVSELIQSLAGFSVERTYLKRNLPTGRGVLQNHYANKVLILINGIASWNAVTGEGNLDRININDIEKIEVLKGPASVLYGTNAYSGTINIVLKKIDGNKISIHSGYGINNSYEAGANINFNKKDLNIFASIHTTNNIDNNVDFIDENNITKEITDYIENSGTVLNINYKSHSILFNAFHSNESYYGVVPKFSAGAGNNHQIKGLLANYTFDHNFSEKINFKFGVTYDYGTRNLSRHINDSIRSSIIGKRVNTFVKSNIDLNKIFSLELGINLDQRFSTEYKNYLTSNLNTVAENNMSDLFLFEHSAFAQIKTEYKKITILAGGRITQNSLSNLNISPRITAVYAINKTNSFKAIIGKSYRSPSLFEYYSTNNKTVFGNQNLQAETAKSKELVYLKSYKKIFFQALIYRAVYENIISRTKDSTIILSNGQTLVNFPDATVYSNKNNFANYGIEIEAKYINPKLINAFFNFDYTISDNGDKSNLTIFRESSTQTDTIETSIYNSKFIPLFNISIGLQKEVIKNLNTSVILNYIGKRGAIEPEYIDAQKLLDINISYKQRFKTFKLTHTLSCKNILDNDLQIPEYSRLGNVNSIPFGTYRYISYTLKADF